jgi:hypothetical protein
VKTGYHRGSATAGKPQTLDYPTYDANFGVFGTVSRYQKDLSRLAQFERERHGHARKYNGIVEGHQSESFHRKWQAKSDRSIVNASRRKSRCVPVGRHRRRHPRKGGDGRESCH